jgi:hypothetical protein
VSLAERLSRVSLFRWRLEWVCLIVVAVSVVLGEQSDEQRASDPYLIVQSGQSATATVRAGRIERHTVSPRWMRNRQELRPFLELEWRDREGKPRSVSNYLLDFESMLAMGIDPIAPAWPGEVRILYLEPATEALTHSGALPPNAWQRLCRPWTNCRVLVLTPGMKTRAEADADLADYLAEWAPRGLWLGLVAFLGLLILRLAGCIDSRPSLE